MKKILLPLIAILTSTMLLAVLPTEAEAAIYDDTVRLHILAESDSEEDQELKLALRDAVLREYGEELSIYQSIEEAKEKLKNKLNDIKMFADNFISERGKDEKTRVTLTTEWYDTRVYESFTLPCGYYTSLRIIIGKGEGKNWWCVMFPPLCLEASIKESSYTQEEEFLITKKYNIKFKILELISEITK